MKEQKENHSLTNSNKPESEVQSENKLKELEITLIELEEKLSQATTEKQKAYKELEDTEEKYNNILDNIGEIYFECDLSGNITFANKAMREMSGYSEEELLGMNYKDFTNEKDSKKLLEIFTLMYEEDTSADLADYEMYSKYGDRKIFEMTASIRKENTEKPIGFRGVVRDVSQRRRIEEALLESEKKYRILANNIPDIIFTLDKTGKIITINDKTEYLIGYTRKEILGKSLNSLIHDEDKERMTNFFIDHKESCSEETRKVEFKIIKKNGDIIWTEMNSQMNFADDGTLVKADGVIRDITTRKTAEKELQYTKNYLNNVFNSLPSMLVTINSNYEITQWNTIIANETGIKSDEAISTILWDTAPFLSTYRPTIEEVLHTGELKELQKEKIYEDQHRFFSITIIPMIFQDMQDIVLRIADVSDKMKIEEMMVQTEKMLSVGGLAAGMAHEINNPLGGIMLSAQNLLRRLSPEIEKNKDIAKQCGTYIEFIDAYIHKRDLKIMLNGILEMGERAAKIVDNLLQFTKRSDSSIEQCDLRKVISKSIELASNDYDLKQKYNFKDIIIKEEYDEEIINIFCIVPEIEQVVLNLVKNSAQALMDKNMQSENPTITFRLKNEKDTIILEIEDNGPGMSSETTKRIFEPFFTTKDVGIGSGLGLTVSYFIITNNHNGEMSVDTLKERGTRFTIKLPKHYEDIDTS